MIMAGLWLRAVIYGTLRRQKGSYSVFRMGKSVARTSGVALWLGSTVGGTYMQRAIAIGFIYRTVAQNLVLYNNFTLLFYYTLIPHLSRDIVY